MGCGVGTRAQEFLDDYSRSQNKKLLHDGVEVGAWNLGSAYAAQVCGTSELTYCGTSVV